MITALLLSGCTSVRPTLKIGLIAPFEGLHRRSGYAALQAARAAIADFPYTAAGILPLALDDGGQPQGAQRAAQKLLADGRLAAVVGPLSPDLADAAGAVLAGSRVRWFAPHALPGDQWAEGLVVAAGSVAAQEGAAGLVLAGWTAGWPQHDADGWSQIAGLPVRPLDDPAGVRADEAVFWLGSAEGGAAYLPQLRAAQPDAVFILGPAGEDPVFAERVLAAPAPAEPSALLGRVYWTAWTDGGYTDWIARHQPGSPDTGSPDRGSPDRGSPDTGSPDTGSPAAYLVYRATLAALAAATGSTVPPDAPPASWNVQVFRYNPAGDWSPVPVR